MDLAFICWVSKGWQRDGFFGVVLGVMSSCGFGFIFTNFRATLKNPKSHGFQR